MLNKGFRDEEKQKVSEALTDLLDIEFVPDLWKMEQERKVRDVLQKIAGTDLEAIMNSSDEDLMNQLQENHFGGQQYEQLGDLLIKTAPFHEEENQQKLAQKSLLLYEFSQIETRTFSFGLIQKINRAKDLTGE
ncbi:hypothetical protein C7S20_06270 [Christiangramia fulva]|uniref:Uncharacterized protein n=1 Tax=Christiangramia fulva TaxID=2126553 RepID=A0A2R3Z3Q1_9FLAO|nr:hypothetical protein [Christiangramia fulva]AVR44903.1 hypothetical protein C7S20_06270 [Christiangramia fulva]